MGSLKAIREPKVKRAEARAPKPPRPIAAATKGRGHEAALEGCKFHQETSCVIFPCVYMVFMKLASACIRRGTGVAKVADV